MALRCGHFRSLFRGRFSGKISAVAIPAFFAFLPSRQLTAKIADPGQVEHLGSQFQGLALKAADVARTLDQVARLTGAQLPILCAVTLQQSVEHLGGDGSSVMLRVSLENPDVL